ncbi:MAG: radical SAM protein [Pseudobdellovibrionaceae bacterium]
MLEAPYKYFLVVTKRCDSRCKYCSIWREPEHQELTLAEFERIALKSPQLKWLNISGGEPTLRDDLSEIIGVFKKNCKNLLMVNFTTNGIDSKRIVEKVKSISELGIAKLVINVSIDGPDRPGKFLPV